MKIKMIKDHNEYSEGTKIDCDEVTSQEFISKGLAVEFTEELKAKEEVEVKAVIDTKVQEQVKKDKKEVKMTIENKQEIEVIRDSSGEWKNINEFLKAVKIADTQHIVDPRLITKASSGLGEDSNPVGGYLVQHPLWNQEIFNQYIQAAVIAPKCRQFVAEPYANGLKFKQVAENVRDGASGTWFGGIQFYEVDEGVSITDSKPVFYQLDVPIKQLGALYYITQALIDDCPNLSQYVAGLVGKAFAQVIDKEILYGDLSIMTAAMGHASTVIKSPAGQYPTALELSKMYNAMAAGYLGRAEWYCSHNQFGQLMQLTAPAASGGAGYAFPIMTVDAAAPTKYRLFGHPVNVMEVGAATNAAGSIIFANWEQYGIVTKGTMTPQVAMSLHVKFDSAQQCYRFISRLGGSPLLYSQITLRDGSNVSSVVST